MGAGASDSPMRISGYAGSAVTHAGAYVFVPARQFAGVNASSVRPVAQNATLMARSRPLTRFAVQRGVLSAGGRHCGESASPEGGLAREPCPGEDRTCPDPDVSGGSGVASSPRAKEPGCSKPRKARAATGSGFEDGRRDVRPQFVRFRRLLSVRSAEGRRIMQISRSPPPAAAAKRVRTVHSQPAEVRRLLRRLHPRTTHPRGSDPGAAQSAS